MHFTAVRKLHSAGVSKSEIARRVRIGRTSVRRIQGDLFLWEIGPCDFPGLLRQNEDGMPLQPHPMLWTAIEETRIIRFAYHGKDRVAEPHDHGILNGSVQLLSWQVAGRSSRRLPNWLLTKVDEMTDLVLLDQTFPGGRPTASGKHIQWDVLFIRVRPANGYLRVGSR